MPRSQPDPAPPLRNAVLITRPGPAAERTADHIRSLGAVPVIAPLLCVQPRPVPAFPHPADAVLLTSANAVPALSACPPAPVLAVGDATAEQARAAGRPDVHSAAGTAADLAALCRDRLRPGTSLLLLSGAGLGATLAADLRAAGFRVHRRVAYHAAPVPRLPAVAAAAIEADRLRAALFLSAETAAVFARLLPPHLRPHLRGIEALAIAPKAAAALAPLPWGRVRVSLRPTLEQVLALL